MLVPLLSRFIVPVVAVILPRIALPLVVPANSKVWVLPLPCATEAKETSALVGLKVVVCVLPAVSEIAPVVIGRKPENLFVTPTGKPRSQVAIANEIRKAILRHLGVKMTPHQFRHLCAKIILARHCL